VYESGLKSFASSYIKNDEGRYSISILKPTRCTMYKIILLLEQHSTCFGWSFHPSSGVQDCTYSNRHMSNRYCWLLASGYEVETCRVSFQKKIIWYIGASSWFYCRNILRCTALWTSNLLTFRYKKVHMLLTFIYNCA